jgi:hypothetical protein
MSKPVNGEIKFLEWDNAQEWGEIFCPMLNMNVMTYWEKGTPCYDTYTAPFVTEDGVYCYRFDQDEGCWHEDMQFVRELKEGELV